MLFAGNAQIAARSFRKPLGILRAGAAADLIVLDYHPFTPFDETNCNSHILFGTSGRNVTTTICNGKILMKDRMLINADEEKIMADVHQEAVKLWRSL